MIHKLALYWRTLSHLKITQIYFRLFQLLRKKIIYRFKYLTNYWYSSKANKNNFKGINILNFGPSKIHQLLSRTDRISFDETHDFYGFTLLNKTLQFKSKIDWSPKETTFLWRYNLHYFEYAYDLGVAYSKHKQEKYFIIFKSLVNDWCENNPIARGIGWDPYPTSLRITNWIKAYHLFSDKLDKNPDFKKLLLNSLYIQAVYLKDNIEYHLKNNHLIENARALFLAGCFFKGKKARNWQKKGLRILWQELKLQVLADGGQFELSPMYHAVVILNYVDVVLVMQGLNMPVPDWVFKILKRMTHFLEWMCMPDGEIAYLNDAAQGMTVPTSHLLAVFRQLNLMAEFPDSEYFKEFPDSGYYIVQSSEKQSKLIFDCGVLGPDFQPGHGHCDMLSFVWSYRRQRVIVDSGVDDYYREDDWRAYYRSTRAHNTVEIDEVEQSEIWGNFRVGRRAHPLFVKYNYRSDIVFLQGSHNGYHHLPGRVSHKRTIVLLSGEILIIFDEIDGGKKHLVKNYLHLHPQFTTEMFSNDKIIAKSSQLNMIVLPYGAIEKVEKSYGQMNPLQGWYAPEFGKRFENDVLKLSTAGTLPIKMGYCLIPVENINLIDRYSVIWKLVDSDLYLDLHSGEKNYHLRIAPDNAFILNQIV